MWYHPHDPDAPDDDETQERDDDDFDPPDDDDFDPSYMPLTDLEERYNAL